MPRNFAEVWSNQVRQALDTTGVAPWLDGVAELDTAVIEMGSGDVGESNIIHIPTTAFSPDVLINNSTYPIAVQAYNDDSLIISLDKYQTKATSIADDKVIGASYRVIEAATKPHIININAKKYQKAIHALCPDTNTASTPVISVKDTITNVFSYDDLVALKDKFDSIAAPMEGRRIVLSSKHYNDLLLDRKNFGDQLINYKAGQAAPVIAGWEVYSYLANPKFTGTTKKAFDALATGTDKTVSVAFVINNVAKKTGLTKQYYKDAKSDPENQTNLLNYRHYFIALPFEKKWIGAIV
jgi:hypothetical protein